MNEVILLNEYHLSSKLGLAPFWSGSEWITELLSLIIIPSFGCNPSHSGFNNVLSFGASSWQPKLGWPSAFLPYRLNPYYYFLDFHIRCILDQWNRDHPYDNGKLPVRSLTPYLRLKYLGKYDADKFRAMGITLSEGTLLRKMWLTDIIQHEAGTYKSPRGFFSILWVVLKIRLVYK
jgi:hypothetical protein